MSSTLSPRRLALVAGAALIAALPVPTGALASERTDRARPSVSFAALSDGARVRTLSARCLVRAASPRGLRRVTVRVGRGRAVRLARTSRACHRPTSGVRLPRGRQVIEARATDAAGTTARTQVAVQVTAAAPAQTGNRSAAAGTDAPAASAPRPSSPATAATSTARPTSTTTATPTAPTTSAPTAPAAPALTGDGLFRDAFLTGDLRGFGLVQRVASDRIRVAAAPDGRPAARVETRFGDHVNGEAPTRAEFGPGDDHVGEGDQRTYSWSQMFAADYPSSTLWQAAGQWKNEGTGSAPITVKVEGDHILFVAGHQYGYRHLYRAPLDRGSWHDFRLRVRWSQDESQGWIELYHQGRLVISRMPYQGLYGSARNYWKLGLYHHEGLQQRAVAWFRDVSITRG